MSNIFIKKSELEKKEKKISKNDIKSMIPSDSLKNKDSAKKSSMIEFRWKIYIIDGVGKYIEISKKYPGKKRVFLNRYGKWVESNVDNAYAQYCKEKYYYYTDR